MSKWSKSALILSCVSLVIMGAAVFILGGWNPFLLGFAVLFLLGLSASVFLDYKLYLEFLSIKTAKRGLSFGWSLVLMAVLLTALSFLVNRFDQHWDLTEEGIHSLSEQSQKALQSLEEDLNFYIFYKGDQLEGNQEALKRSFKNILSLYKQESSKVKTAFVDSYRDNLKAEKFLSDLADRRDQSIFVFVSYKNRKIRVHLPLSENALTSAVIKAQKREFKEIVFLTGHGERKLESDQAGGLKILNQSLKDSGFVLKEWDFVRQGPPLGKAPALMMSLGPRQAFLPAEMDWLKAYLSKGGNLVLGLDSKEKHQLQTFLKDYGLSLNNDFIFSLERLNFGGLTMGLRPTRHAVGTVFNRQNPITKNFSSNAAVIFETASSIDLIPSDDTNFKHSVLVQTARGSYAVSDPSDLQKEIKKQADGGPPLTLAVEVSQKEDSHHHKSHANEEATKAEEKTSELKDKTETATEDKNFRLLVFGDSDFLSNKSIDIRSNRDLILNTVISMAGEEEPPGIRAKRLKETKMTLNRMQKNSFILLYVSFPLSLLLFGLWLWYRKRGA